MSSILPNCTVPENKIHLLRQSNYDKKNKKNKYITDIIVIPKIIILSTFGETRDKDSVSKIILFKHRY